METEATTSSNLPSSNTPIEFIKVLDIAICEPTKKTKKKIIDPLAITDDQYLNIANKNVATTSATQNDNDSIISKILQLKMEKSEEKFKYIKFKRPQPKLPDLKIPNQTKSGGRKPPSVYHFRVSNYERFDWLTGCESTNKMYCWPCIFFAGNKSPFTRGKNICSLPYALITHCKSSEHNDAVKEFNNYSSLNLHSSEICLLQHPSQAQPIAPKPKMVSTV
jgi:hypothetical protein